MKPSTAKQVLKVAAQNQHNILLVGAPGVGKTYITIQAMNEIGYDCVIFHPAVSSPTDFKGFPWMSGGKARFVPYGELEQLVETDKPTLCFFDDLGQAPTTVQAAIMQILWGRSLNGTRLSTKVSFAAATNRRQDMAGVQGLLEPVKSRFASIIEVEPDVDELRQYILRKGYSPVLAAFLKMRPEVIDPDNNPPSRDMVNHVCPRTIEFVGQLLSAPYPKEAWYPLLSGAAGEGFAVEFDAFQDLAIHLPDPDAVLRNPNKIPLPGPSQPSHIYALCGALVGRVNKKNFRAAVDFALRIPPEFGAMFMQDLITIDPSFCEEESFIKQFIPQRKEFIIGL